MKGLIAVSMLLITLVLPVGLRAQNPVVELDWQKGPGTGAIDNRATIDIPEGFAFLNAAETKKYVEMSQNLSASDEYLFAPADGGWEAYFSFSADGYVKDNEELDADELLQSIKDNQEAANVERKRRGWPAFTIVGWHLPPRYNPNTKVLEWATILKAENSEKPSVNYNTRVLGRKGTMSVQLVSAPEQFDAGLMSFQDKLKGFEYSAGERYADYRSGDHVAEYGLAALVAGGAAAVAAKKGFFGVIAAFFAAAWKFVLAALIGVGVWLKSLLGKKKGEK